MGPQLRTGSHGALSAPPHSVPQLPMVSHKVPSPIWLDWRLFTELVSTGWGPGSLVLVRHKSNCKPAAGPSRRFLGAWSVGYEFSFPSEASFGFLFAGKN